MIYTWTIFRKLCVIFLFGLVLNLVWVNVALAFGPGDLDTSFNGTGIVTTTISGDTDIANTVAIQPDDNKIVVAGTVGPFSSRDIAVTRYNSDGTLDPTFGTNGIISTSISSGDDSGNAVAIQPDGNIVVVGERGTWGDSEIAVLRYDTNGNPDGSFNSSGVVTTPITNVTSAFGSSVAIQPDGKIVAVGNDGGSGNVHFIVIRYTITGSLDSSFNNTGIVTTSFGSYTSGSSVAIQDDGKIVVAGSGGLDFVVARYTITGSLDLSFNDTGVVTTPISTFSTSGAAVAIQDDGKIVVAGNSWVNSYGDSDLAVARYTITGSLDSTFNNSGIVHTPIDNQDEKVGIALQPNGKIVVTSLTSGFGKSDITVVRYDQDGNLDTTLKGTGIVTTSIGDGFAQGRSVAIQPDDKIVVAGGDGSNFVVVRYFGDPNLHLKKTASDASPNSNQLITYTITISNSGIFSTTNARISDTLPSGVTFVGPVTLMPSGTGIAGEPPILAHDLTIAAGQLITVTIPVTVNNDLIGGTIITNTTVVTSVDTFPITDSTSITIASIPAVMITKTVNTETASVGEMITYTYRVTNTGNISLTNLIANDIPLGAISFNNNNLPPGQDTTGTLTYTVVEDDLPGPLTNTVVVTGIFRTDVISASTSISVALLEDNSDDQVYLPVILKNN